MFFAVQNGVSEEDSLLKGICFLKSIAPQQQFSGIQTILKGTQADVQLLSV